MAILLANNANGNLSGAITAADTTITLQTGQGDMFPIPNTATGDFFPVTLVRPTGELEICYCTAREGDVLTVTRARESTTAKIFSVGDRVSLRLTTGVMQNILDVVTNITQFTKTLLDAADAATARTTLGAQASDATLTALSGVTTAADKLIYATAPDVFATTSITPFARTLIDDVDAAAMRTTLGVDGIESKVFEALRRSYAEAGFNLVDGSFEEGGVLSAASDVIITASGAGYSWGGPEFPHNVASGTDPTITSGYVLRDDVFLNTLATPDSTVSIAGLAASKVRDASDNVRAATIITESGAQTVSAEQIGSSLLFTAATAVAMPTLASLGGVTGHYRIMAGSDPITLTLIDGASFTVRGATIASVTIPAGADCYVVYTTAGVYVYGLATYETIKKSYCLVNATGTGAPNELVSTKLPANITINSRYVLTNPFGANTPVICWAEIFVDNKWSRTGYSSATGVGCSYVQGEGIIIQTADTALLNDSIDVGGGHGYTIPSTTTTTYPNGGPPGVTTTTYTYVKSAKCRVFVQKLGA